MRRRKLEHQLLTGRIKGKGERERKADLYFRGMFADELDMNEQLPDREMSTSKAWFPYRR